MAEPARKYEWLQKGITHVPRRDRDVPNIFTAAAMDDAEGITAAIRSGDKVNAVDSELMTPLHYAAASLSYRAVDRLLEELASGDPLDPTLVDAYGRTASRVALEVQGEAGGPMARKLQPFCYPANE